jgi:hypothetical protein
MRRKKRHRLPKVADNTPGWGTVPLGQDPPFGPWGPVGQIEAYGKIARAWNDGSLPRRRAGIFLLAGVALSAVAGLIGWVVGIVFN